jgi:hypothetical protein
MKFEKYLGILLSIFFLSALYLTSLPNSLFIGGLVELFSIVVACYIFIKIGVFEESGLYLKTPNLVAFNTFIKDRPRAVKSVLQGLIKSEEF